MGDEATDGTTDTTTQQPASTARGTATGALLTPPPAQAAATNPPAQQATPAARAAVTGGQGGGADRMSPEALTMRLRREREAADRKWATSLGFKTPEEAKTALEEAQSLKAERDAAKLAEMNELDRVKAQLAQANETIALLKQQIDTAETETLRERETRMLTDTAQKFVAPRYARTAIVEFREYLRTLDEEDVAKMRPTTIERWFSTYARDRPALAASSGAAAEPSTTPATPAPKTEPRTAPAVRRPITTGGPPPRAARPGAPLVTDTAAHMLNGKTAKPGQPNSMSAAEVRQFAKKNGINYPGGRAVNSSRAR